MDYEIAINIDTDHLDNDTHNLIHENKVIGQLIKNQDNDIVLEINTELPLKITGKLQGNQIDISTRGHLNLNSAITSQTNLTITSPSLGINQAIKCVDTVQLNVNERVLSNKKINAESVYINSNDVILNDVVKAQILNVNVKDHFENNKHVIGHDYCAIDAKNITNHGVIAGKLQINASQQITNSGQFITTAPAKIKTPKFVDSGKLDCHAKTSLYCDEYHASDEAQQKNTKLFKFVGKQYDNAGKKLWNGPVYFNAQNFTNQGSIELHDKGFIHVNNFNLAGGDFVWMSQPFEASLDKNARVLRVDDTVKLASQAKLKLDHVNTMSHRINTEKNSLLDLNNSFITTDVLKSEGNNSFSKTNLTASFTTTNGKNRIDDSSINIKKRMRQLEQADSEFNHSRIITENIENNGSLNLLNTSQIDAKFITNQGEIALNHSSAESDTFISTHTSHTHSENESLWRLHNYVLIDGKNDFTNTMIDAPRFINKGHTKANNSLFSITQRFENSKEANLDAEQSLLRTGNLNLSGNYQFKQSHIQNTNSFLADGQGLLTESLLKTQDFEVMGNTSFTSDAKSQIIADTMLLAGTQIAKQTAIKTNQLYQQKGKFQTEQSSIQIDNAILTENTSQLHLQQSLLDAKQASAVLEGYTKLKQSAAAFQQASLQTTWAEESQIKSQEAFILTEDQLFDRSEITAKNMSVMGNAAFNNHTQVSTESNLNARNSQTSFKNSQLNAKYHINLGRLTLNQSKVLVDNFSNYNKTRLSNQSNILAQQDFQSGFDSDFASDESVLQARSINFKNKLDANQSSLLADDDINFAYQSNAKLRSVYAAAKNKIKIARSAKLNGESFSVKTKELRNLGRIDLTQGFSADVDYLFNYGGYINGGEATHLDANVFFYNQGRIKAANVMINAPCIVNECGDICGYDHLIENSLVNVNVAGSKRSFNVFENSLLSANYGLILPAIPTHLSSLFSWYHVLASTRALASNLFPHMQNTINLGYFVAVTGLPLVYSSSKKIYELATHKAELPTFSDIKNLKWKDILPAVVALKSVVVAGANMPSMLHAVPREFGDISAANFKNDISQFDASALFDVMGEAISPITTAESIVGINQGIIASATTMQNNLYAANLGLELGALENTHYARYFDNNGVFIGNKTILAGKKLNNRGVIADYESMAMQFDDITNYENAYLYGRHAAISSKSYVNSGQQEYHEAQIAVDQYTSKGRDIYDATTIQAATIDLYSDAILKGELSLIGNKVNLHQQSNISGPYQFNLVSEEKGLMQGRVKVRGLFADTPVDNPYDFIQQKNQYENIESSDSFVFKTKDSLQFDDAITNRKSNIGIIAKDIAINHEQQSEFDLYFEAEEGDVEARADLHANKLTLKAKHDVNTYKHEYTANQNIYIDAENNYSNQGGLVHAQRDLFIRAKNGDINNLAGNLKGDNHVQLIAGHDLFNQVTERDVQGRYDVMKEWQVANIEGGKGEGYEDIGVYIKTGNKTFNDASVITADKNVLIEADGGFESDPRINTYLADKRKKRYGAFKHKKKIEKTYDTQVLKPEVSSRSGKIIIYCKNGEINSVATNFLAPEGKILAAKGKVQLLDVIVGKQVIKYKSSFWGATSSKEKRYTETSIPTIIVNPTDTTIISLDSDVVMRNPVIVGPGHLSVSAGHDIIINENILNNSYSQKSNGFYISVAGIPIIKSHSPNAPITLPHLQPDPTYQHIQQLANSNGSTETVLNAWNTGIDIANTGNSFMHGIRNGDYSELLNRYNIGQFDPSVSFNTTHQSEKLDYQTRGGGYIAVGSAEFVAGNEINFTGLPITIQNNAHIKAKRFIQDGIYLDSSYSNKSSTVGMGLTARAHVYDVNVSGHQSKQKNHILQNQIINIGGNLNIEVDTWEMNGANANVGHISGFANNIVVESKTSQTSMSQSGYGIASNGNFNYSNMHGKQQWIDHPSGLYVKDSINPDNNNEFYVKNINLYGGKILSGGEVNLHPETIVAHDVEEYNHTHGFSISGNINNLLPKQQDEHLINASDDKAKQIATIPVIFDEYHYRADQHAVIYGEQATNVSADKITGTLVTDSVSGKTIKQNETHQYRAEIPVTDEATLRQMRDNFTWSLNKLGITDYVPTYHDPILAFEHLVTPEDVQNYVDKIKLMHELSKDVYDGDHLPDGYEIVAEYRDPNYDAKVVVYKNEINHTLIFAFKGTDSTKQLRADDIPIGFGKRQPSYNQSMQNFISEQVNHYKNEYQIAFTGHSAGASQASLASNDFGYPAYTFDNPGINDPKHELNFSRVTSFQSSPNIVNSGGALTNRNFNQGNVIQLSDTTSQSLMTEAGKQLGGFGLLTATTFHHKMSENEKSLDEYLQRQLNKAAPNNSYNHYSNNKNMLFAPRPSDNTKNKADNLNKNTLRL